MQLERGTRTWSQFLRITIPENWNSGEVSQVGTPNMQTRRAHQNRNNKSEMRSFELIVQLTVIIINKKFFRIEIFYVID